MGQAEHGQVACKDCGKQFRWKQELATAAKTTTRFLSVTLTDSTDQSPAVSGSMLAPAPEIVGSIAPKFAVDPIGEQRVRFDRDGDPETIRRLVNKLEGPAP